MNKKKSCTKKPGETNKTTPPHRPTDPPQKNPARGRGRGSEFGAPGLSLGRLELQQVPRQEVVFKSAVVVINR